MGGPSCSTCWASSGWFRPRVVKPAPSPTGLTPAQAIHAGTGAAARILGAEKDLGTIEVGKWADLVILDADLLADIRNTRRIWQVVHYGRVVDRPAILKTVRPR
jgi:cytosine/adenosine deaminase-related metal-dependent hydrolase